MQWRRIDNCKLVIANCKLRRGRHWSLLSVILQFAIINCHFAISSVAAEPEFSREQLDFFEKQVRPVLAAQCWNCHSKKKAESGLRLDSREAVLKGGDRGEVVTLREASASLLIHAVRRDGELQMPPNGRLTADQIAALTKWIELGLPWPREVAGSALAQAWRTHWALQPVTKPNVPAIAEDSWSQSPVDRFVLERLLPLSGGRESPGSARASVAGANWKDPGDLRPPLGKQSALTLAARADRRTLIRRATFDLLGLPPTPDEVAEFAADLAPDAFERLVDRLLASPKYGERWGRHWLDVARYADTKGYVFFEEKSYPWAYTYRDYVVRSLNEDKPYDQFVTEQLAADVLGEEGRAGHETDDMTNQPKNPSPPAPLPAKPGRGEQERAEQLPALGFLTVGSHFMGNVHDIVDDRIDVVTRGLMGLTVTCARCHDHKYDPIPTADYYSLYGVFRSTTEPLVLPLFAPPNDTPDYRRFTAELSLRQQKLDDFVRQKHGALVEGARTRVGEYLLAAKAANEKPATDDFMLIADPGDLNPAMIVRWQAYLGKVEGGGLRVEGQQEGSNTHPVWGVWFALAALSEERFKNDAAALCSMLVSAEAEARRIATVVPSLPTLGERARVRGPNGEDAPDLASDAPLSPSPRRGGPGRGADARGTPDIQSSPLPNPPRRGEGTRAGEAKGREQEQEQPPHPNPLPLKAGGEGTKRTNPLVVKAVCGEQPPASLSEVAARYGALMKSVHLKWQAALREAVILKRPAPEGFTDPDEEELRVELYGEAAPANVPLIFGWGFLSLLPDRASQGEYQKVLKEVEQWLIGGPGSPPRAMVLNDGETFDPRVFVRGNPHRLGDAVPRQFLSAIERGERKPFTNGSGRLELARAIVDPSNPLTARVMVNRVWQHHFGAGLVRTPGDFGMRSDPPTHPELLDWLSGEFVGDHQILARRASEGLPQLNGQPSLARRASQAWSLKCLHRLILSSRVYQQSSLSPSGFDTDPENRLLSHANRRRLDFEATRDALLFVTGQLDDRVGGPSQPMLDGGFHPRRTVYATLDRLDPPSLLSVFDFPSLAATSASRDTTTVSPQALFLMNGPLVATVSQLIVQRGDVSREPDTSSRVRHLTHILFSREPTSQETRLATEFLGPQPSSAAWPQFAQALLLTNEFVFVD